MKNLLILTSLTLLFVACQKENLSNLEEESPIVLERLAIQEFWPLSEAVIDEDLKTITLKIPAWASDNESVHLYFQTDIPGTPSTGESIQLNNLKSLELTDDAGLQKKYTVALEKPTSKAMLGFDGSEKADFIYENGKIKTLNYQEEVHFNGAVKLQNLSYDVPRNGDGDIDLIEFPFAENAFTPSDTRGQRVVTFDEYNRLTNSIFLLEETLRLTYDIENQEIIADFRINYAAGGDLNGMDANIQQRYVFSDFDHHWAPQALASEKDQIALFASVFQYYNQQENIDLLPLKLLLSNPGKVTVVKNYGRETPDERYINYTFQGPLLKKVAGSEGETEISYQ